MARLQFPVFMDSAEKHPVGSPEWAGRVSLGVHSTFGRLEDMGVRPLVEELKKALPGKPWLVWPPEQPWGDRATWCRELCHLSWKGVVNLVAEVDPDAARELELLAAEEDAKGLKRGGKNNPEGHNQHTPQEAKGNDITIDHDGDRPDRGTSAVYLLRRLQRLAEAGDNAAAAALEDYREGRLPSVRAAAKAVGLVHEPSPLRQLHRWWGKASREERARFTHENRAELLALLGEPA